MVDKAAILAEVVRRNALRKEAKLPEIDVDFEYRFACAEAEYEEYLQLCKQPQHAAARARCRERATAAYRKRRGPDAQPYGLGGRYAIGRDTDRRFTRYMRRVLGRSPPLPPVRHPTVYGGG